MKRKCRDCGRMGSEAPDDPAPALCPACYEKRLQRIDALFRAKLDAFSGTDITPLIVWLAGALEVIGGETHKYARMHANTLGFAIALESNQRQN